MLESAYLCIVSIVFLLAVMQAGQLVLSVLKLPLTRGIERTFFTYLCGSISLSYAVHYLGATGLLYTLVLVVIVTVLAVLQLVQWQRRFVDVGVHATLSQTLRDHIPDAFARWSLGVLFFVLLPLLPYLLLLPISWDGTAYHLPLAKLFLTDHWLSFYEWFPQTTYPVGILSLYTYAQSLAEIRLSNIIAFSYIPLTAYYMLNGLNGLFKRSVVVLATLLFLFRPLLYSESAVTTFIDYGFAAFGLAFSISLLKYQQEQSKSWLVLSIILAVFLGLVKFTGLFFIPALLVSLVVLFGGNIRKLLAVLQEILHRQSLLVMLIVCTLPFVYWYGRNAWYTKNPVHPYFNNYFKGFDYDPKTYVSITSDVKQINTFMSTTIDHYLDDTDTPIDYVNLAEMLFLLSSAVLLVCAIVFTPSTTNRILIPTILFVYVPIVLLIGPLFRYYLPIVPTLALLISESLVNVATSKKWWRYLPLVVAAVALAVQLDAVFYARNQFFFAIPKRAYVRYVRNYPFLLAQLNRQDNFAVIQYANQHLDHKRSKVVTIFDNRTYYFEMRAQFMNPSKFGYFTNPDAMSAQSVYDTMRRDGVTHLVISNNWGKHANLREQIFDDFLQTHVTALYSANNVTLYALK